MLQKHLFRVFNGFPLTIWFLGLGCLINISGLSLLWPVNAIYIHLQLKQPMTVAGFVLMLYSGAGFVGSFVGGWLYDKLGAIKVLVVGLAVAAVAITLPAFLHGWVTYVVVMIVFGITSAIPFPVLSSLAGHAWPEGGRSAFNFLYVANNLGVAIGTALGGILAQISFQTVFLGISGAYVVFILLVLTLFRRPFSDVYLNAMQNHNTHQEQDEEDVAQSYVPWGALCVLFLGFILSWSVYVQWQAVISVYMQSLGFSLSSYSVLWTLNGLLIFATQPLVSWVVKRFPSLTLQMIGGIVLFGASFAVIFHYHQYSAFVIAMVLTTLGEIFVWPAVPAAVAQVSPPNRVGALQGMVSSAATFGRMVGPLVGGMLYDIGSIHLVLSYGLIALVFPFFLFLLYRRLLVVRNTRSETGMTV